MSIRMPSSIETRQMLLALQQTQDRLAQNTQRISSGNRITSPGDDPAGAAAIVDLGSSIQTNTQFQSQADSANAFLQSSGDVLNSVTNDLTTLQQLAQQGMTSTTDAAGRASIAAQVDALRTNLTALANTKVQGKYLFSGTLTQTQPFNPLASSDPLAINPTPYGGNSNPINLNVTVGTTVTTNVTGDKAFYTTDAAGNPIDLFQVTAALSQGLTSNNTAQIQTAYDNLQRLQTSVTQVQTDVGGRQAGLTDLKNILSSFNVSLQSLQNNVQDTNYPETITQFTSDQTVQSATLSAMAKTGSQQSLFNYLG